MAKVIRGMALPVLTEFRVISRSLRDLGASLDLVRTALRHVRRMVCFSDVPSVVGAFHASLMPNGKTWNAHCHLVVDAGDVEEFDEWEEQVNARFKQFTGGRGTFSLPERDFLVHVPERIAAHICKAQTCSPPPGKLGPKALETLLDGLHARHLGIHWGTTARGRTFP